MRNWRATKNLIAVSANNAETAINTEQTLDTSMLVSVSDIADLERKREPNDNELTGLEEADSIYNLGATSKLPMNFARAQAQHFAFLLAFGLGSVSTAAAGSGYEHTITPIAGDLDGDRSLPTFSGGQRYGLTVLKRLFASWAVNSSVVTLARDSWAKIVGQVVGTGKVTNNVTEETVNAAGNSVSLALAANAVEGSDAAARLANVQSIKVELTAGVWTDVAYSAVSAATPAVITISDPGGGAGLVDYKILYIPAESGWMTFPSRVTETPLRVAQMTLTVGGKWTGAAFEGGKAMTSELKQLEWALNNNLQVQFVPGAGDSYASRIFREGRMQTIKLDKEFRNYILQQFMDDNETFGIYVLLEGDVYDTPHKYQVEMIFPKVGILTAPLSVDGKVLAEAGDLRVLEDATYGSVIVKVKNLQATYAA